MSCLVRLDPSTNDYPQPLRILEVPPLLTISGPLSVPKSLRRVAIVGSRVATDDAQAFAFQLAYFLARANVVVVSGGALGIDTAAHEGALHANGTTWLVACAGAEAPVFPKDNAPLFAHIKTTKGASRIIYPFDDYVQKDGDTPRERNKVLVGLAECVVVLQARIDSGSRNAMRLARDYDRPVYAAPGPPWDASFRGAMAVIAAEEASVLFSIEHLFASLNLPPPDLDDEGAVRNGKVPPKLRIRQKAQRVLTYAEPPHLAVHAHAWSEEEKTVFSKLSLAPEHQDKIIAKCGLGTSSALTALLTLSLKDVVVEGPDGFFRRRTSS